jgi:MFS family permease
MNFTFTVVAMFLIDKAGRRTLLLIGAVGMAPCLAALAAILHLHQFQYLLVWILAGYIASFAISQGSVVWVYVSEIFPNRVRGRGEALSSFFGMTLGAATANVFPAMRERSAPLTFLFFAAMVVLQFFVVWRYYPETKGVTLEEMQRRLGIVDEAPMQSTDSNVSRNNSSSETIVFPNLPP